MLTEVHMPLSRQPHWFLSLTLPFSAPVSLSLGSTRIAVSSARVGRQTLVLTHTERKMVHDEHFSLRLPSDFFIAALNILY